MGQRSPDSLRALADARGITMGAAVASEQIHNDPELRDTILAEFAAVVPEWEMKWATVRKERGQFQVAGADAIAQFARQNCLRMRGHPLIWHSAMPPWVANEIGNGHAMQMMESHIQATVTRFSDVVHSWDVVNEAVQPEDKLDAKLRNSPWLRAIGPAYIDLAFRLAHQADPRARLVYNDYNVEYDASKAEAILALIKGLRDRGVPIDAVGLQSHLWVSRRRLRPETLRNFCRNVTREGLDILITELDVRESDYSLAPAVRDAKVAAVAKEYLEIVFSEVTPKEVTFWGVSDRYSWLSKPSFNPENPDGHLNRGLPFDTNMKRKPIWQVTRDVIAAVPQAKEKMS